MMLCRLMERIKYCRTAIHNGGWDAPEFVALVGMVFAAFVVSIGFFFGCTISAQTGRVIFLCGLVYAFVCSRRRGIEFLLLVSCCIGLTCYTFSYAAADVAAYHFPAQNLLRIGWNPVFDSTVEKFQAQVTGYSLRQTHALFLPHFVALCGALVAKSLSLFAGDAFLNYLLFFALLKCAYGFARDEFKTGRLLAILFSAGVSIPVKITAFLCGQTDYVVYCSVLIAVFTLCEYDKYHRTKSLVYGFMCLLVAILTKSTGFLMGGAVLVILLIRHVRVRAVWVGVSVIGGMFAIVGASPYLTSWIQYGGPFYPLMTFDPKTQLIDITDDFTTNAAGAKMGYLARVCWVWLSHSLAEWFCEVYYGVDQFKPVFNVPGGCDGLGPIFRMLMIFSISALVLSKFTIVAFICVLLCFLGNLGPLKYIGYGRYFMIMWAVPFLAIYNLHCYPRKLIKDNFIYRIISWCGLSLLVCITVFVSLRTAAYYGKTLGEESERQKILREAERLEHGVRFLGTPNYTVAMRVKASGIVIGESNDDKLPIINDVYGLEMFNSSEIISPKTKPIANSPKEILRYDWVGIFKNFPHPIWVRE